MKVFKDKKIIVLAILLLVFTVGYFIVASRVSYAFEEGYDMNDTYDSLVYTIEKSAESYASKNKELFSKENTIFIKVQDLINSGLLIANTDGKIINPVNNNELNDRVIKIKKDNDKYIVSIDN